MQETGIDLSKDRMALQRLRDAAERAKIELSSTIETEVNLPFITADASGPQHLVKTLSRSRLEQLVGELITRTEGPCLQALSDANIAAGDIDDVVLVGGMSRMPAVQEKGKGIFNKEQKIVIQSSSGLAQDEIDQMVDDAKSHEEEDQVRRAEIETRNQADTLVYTTEKMISDNSDTIPDELKEEVEGKIAILKGAIEANNLPEMQTSMTDLNDALQRLGQAVYSQASDAGMPPDMTMEDVTVSDDSEATDPPSDDTIEGEFREVQ